MITITKDRKGMYFFHVTSKNNKILCHSEGYTRKGNCINAIKVLEEELVLATDIAGNLQEGKFIDKTNGKK